MTLPTYRNTGERWDWELSQGASFGPVRHALRNPDGTLVDLTGCIVRGQVRRNPASPTVVAEFGIAYAPVRTDGWYEFSLTDTDTAAMTAGARVDDTASTYAYDIELVDATGRVFRLLYGALRLRAEVTR